VSFSEFDQRCMRRALELAERALETTDPNPRVGSVVARDQQIIGEGWHERPGEAHAEVLALRAAGDASRGADLYVTLEPCSHFGRTPPCINALLEAGVGRVVCAMVDPDSRVRGSGIARLKEAGVKVESGLCEVDARALNPGFIQRLEHGLPWVRVKFGASLDGRTALADGQSRWITSEESRADVQRWRARSSAVLTGAGTVLADDPRLDVRLPEPAAGTPRRQPLRVVLDGRLRTPAGARLFSTGGEVLLLTALASLDEARAAALSAHGARIETLPASDGRLELPAVLDRLGELEMNEVLVEAGPTLAGELVQQQLADELLLYVAPKLLGPTARALLEIPAPRELKEASALRVFDTLPVGEDLRLRLRPRAPA
jgi:diaminohydroxyphosphoribosylaminopyrimidine deaminase/5-amino-6-(5-phosphoribosylamino)uracil reductase